VYNGPVYSGHPVPITVTGQLPEKFQLTTPENTQIPKYPKFCINIVFSFSWGLKWPQEKLKTMLVQNFGLQRKSILVCYGIFWSGQLPYIFCKVDLYIAVILHLTVTSPFPNSDRYRQV